MRTTLAESPETGPPMVEPASTTSGADPGRVRSGHVGVVTWHRAVIGHGAWRVARAAPDSERDALTADLPCEPQAFADESTADDKASHA
jgi:hypothetical protein